MIAQIRGLCVGGGLELTTTCDLRICGSGARFGIPVKRLGLVVSYTELKPLLDLIGPANALEVLLEGRIHSADDALRMGLVNRVVADDEVEHEVFATAMRIAEGAPLVARWHKKFTRRLMQPEALATKRWTRASTASEPRTSGRATGRSWRRANPSSGVGEWARPRALGG